MDEELAACVSAPPGAIVICPTVDRAVVSKLSTAARWMVRLPDVESVPVTRNVGAVVPEALPRTRLLKDAGTAPAIRTVELESMAASSAEVGTCVGDQFAAVNQSVLAEPFQDSEAADASRAVTTRTTAKAAAR